MTITDMPPLEFAAAFMAYALPPFVLLVLGVWLYYFARRKMADWRESRLQKLNPQWRPHGKA